MRYPGGKNSTGTYQTIINQIPPHKSFVEPFFGSGGILRHKLEAYVNIGVEIDPQVLHKYWPEEERNKYPWLKIINGCGIEFLEAAKSLNSQNTFIYCDPPYLIHTRQSQRNMYRFEMDERDHARLLLILTSLDCMVALSGYPSPLYAHYLSDWRTITYYQQTRSGSTVEETIWMNYPEPTQLHDYQYLGNNYRERERIKKKIARWTAKLKSLPSLEREAIMESLKTI